MSLKSRVRLTISYDGTDFYGWQKQSRADQPSIQQTLEQILSQIFQQEIKVTASGRTDRGVHARAQVVHFDCPVDPRPLNILYKLNSMSPDSLSVIRAQTAPPRFHSQLWARKKRYIYRINHTLIANPFERRFALHHPYPLELEKLNAIASVLVGTHDFKSFQSQGTPVPDTIRTIEVAQFTENSTNGVIEFEIVGSGFLKQMVRNIVGTLLDLYKDGRGTEDLITIINAKDRRSAGRTAPAHGLFLDQVFYEPQVEAQCKDLPSHLPEHLKDMK